MMSQPLASRIALVTGASRGIGYATARALAKAGAHIVAVARTQAGLEELDDEIRTDGGSATLVPLVLTARAYRAEAMERRDGDQRDGEFPTDPLHGAAAQAVRCRPRGVRHLGRREQSQCLSRSLCRHKGRARDAGAGVGQ